VLFRSDAISRNKMKGQSYGDSTIYRTERTGPNYQWSKDHMEDPEFAKKLRDHDDYIATLNNYIKTINSPTKR
jgi:hypothetical protein